MIIIEIHDKTRRKGQFIDESPWSEGGKMKILFLHLSDAHLRDNTELRVININAIVNSLVQIGEFDECALVFSGDIVNAGDKNSYAMQGNLWVISQKTLVRNILTENMFKHLLCLETMTI